MFHVEHIKSNNTLTNRKHVPRGTTEKKQKTRVNLYKIYRDELP